MSAVTNEAPKPKAAPSSRPDDPIVLITIETNLTNVEDIVRFVKKQEIDGLRVTFPVD